MGWDGRVCICYGLEILKYLLAGVLERFTVLWAKPLKHRHWMELSMRVVNPGLLVTRPIPNSGVHRAEASVPNCSSWLPY